MGFNLMAMLQQAMTQQMQPAYQQAQAQAAPPSAALAQPQSRYEWSPDHTSFIDRSKYPDAVWHERDEGGGSEGAQGSPAGWYMPSRSDTGSEGAYTTGGQRVDPFQDVANFGGDMSGRTQATYRDLKDAGMWNLKDPNSDAWKYLQAMSNAPGVRYTGDPQHNAGDFARALSNASAGSDGFKGRNEAGRANYEADLREALADLDPRFVDQIVPAMGGQLEGYWTASKQAEGQGFWKDVGDTANVYRDMFTQTPLGVAIIAFTGGAAAGAMGGAAEGGAAAEGIGAGAAAGEIGAGGAMDMGVGLEGMFEPGLEGLGAGGAMDMGVGLDEVFNPGLDFASGGGTVPDLTELGNTPAGPATPQGFDDSTLFGEEPGSFAQQNIGSEFNQQAGITPNADQFVNTNPEGQLFDNGGMDQYGYSGEVDPETMGAPNPTGKGLLESSLDWANKNPFVAGMGLQVAGGLLKGVGDNQTAKDVQERKIEGEKELQAQKTAQQLALEEERRKKIQSGSYFDAKIPIRPSGQPLRRPDGSLVYPTNSPLLASRVA